MSMDSLLRAEPNDHQGNTNVWLTPRWLLRMLGPFDLDPCGHPGWETAKTHYYEADDGLSKNWEGTVWCNPPYGESVGRWVGKWIEHGNGFLLVACRSDTTWWQAAARKAEAIYFPRGRISFLDKDTHEEVHGTAFASCIFAAGFHAAERLRLAGANGILIRYPDQIQMQGDFFE